MMAKYREPRDPQAVYAPPQPTFIAACWRCRALLMRGKGGTLVSACLGVEHHCATKEADHE